jgi:hypothetical protein
MLCLNVNGVDFIIDVFGTRRVPHMTACRIHARPISNMLLLLQHKLQHDTLSVLRTVEVVLVFSFKPFNVLGHHHESINSHRIRVHLFHSMIRHMKKGKILRRFVMTLKSQNTAGAKNADHPQSLEEF